MAQLVRANQALYDYALAFTVPCVSGKDSMKNDSTRGGRKISIPPTVLFSVMGKIDDAFESGFHRRQACGGCRLRDRYDQTRTRRKRIFCDAGKIGTDVPKVDAATANKIYAAYHKALNAGLIHSAISPAIGGLAIAAARAAMGGRLGLSMNLPAVPSEGALSDLELLFSESNSRFLITCAKADVPKLKEIFAGLPFAEVGATDDSGILSIRSASGTVEIPVEEMVAKYKVHACRSVRNVPFREKRFPEANFLQGGNRIGHPAGAVFFVDVSAKHQNCQCVFFQNESPVGGDCSVSQESLFCPFFPGDFDSGGEFRFVGLGCDDNGCSVRSEISGGIDFRIVQTVQQS